MQSAPLLWGIVDRLCFGDKKVTRITGARPPIMSQILNLSEHTNDDELQRLTTLLLFHLVEQCGGQVQFKLEDAQRVRTSLTTKMVQMQVGDEVRLRIIDRLPELQ